MNMNIKHLLSDRFVEFSQKVTDVHGRIKDLRNKYQADLKALTDEAESLNVEFEGWQKEQDTPSAEKLQKVAAAKAKAEQSAAPVA